MSDFPRTVFIHNFDQLGTVTSGENLHAAKTSFLHQSQERLQIKCANMVQIHPAANALCCKPTSPLAFFQKRNTGIKWSLKCPHNVGLVIF